MIAHDFDRALLDRTVTLAKQTRPLRVASLAGRTGFLAAGGPWPRRGYVESPRPRAADRGDVRGDDAQDPAPGGPGRRGRDPTGRARASKRRLDIDWGDPAAQADALARLLAEVDRVEAWVAAHVPVAEAPTVQAALTALRRVLVQDLEPDPTTGQRRIRRGVAPDRMPSLGDPEMRHGRKTRTKLFTGYKRHVMKLVDADLIVGAVVRPANEPEHQALALLEPDLVQHGPLAEVQIDRGYLGSARDRGARRAGRGDSREGLDQHESRAVSQAGLHD